MKEHLAHFHLPDGKTIDIHKNDNDISITTKDHTLIIPHATGQQTLDWCALLESLSESVEYPDD